MDALQDLYATAVQLARLQRHPEALEAVEAALEADASDTSALALKAALLLETGRAEAALGACDQALALDPLMVRAHSNRGDALRRLGRLDDALASYDRALELDRAYATALINRGNALLDAGRPADALASFDAALALNAGVPQTHSNRACALTELERYGEALASTDRALAISPRFANAWRNRGDALFGLKHYAAALENYRRAATLDPEFYEALTSIGAALRALRRYDEAIAAYDDAERLRPGAPAGIYQRSGVRLLTGDFARGWRDYEARWRTESFLKTSTGFVTPDVRSKLSLGLKVEDLAGRRILLATEQGIGDQLMFLSMLPDLLQVAAGVACICDRRMKSLLENSFPQVLFFDSRDGAPPNFGRYDMVVAAGDLGQVFRNRAADFPGQAYVRPRAEAVEAWAARLGPRRSKLRVGLSWRGGTKGTNAGARSIPLPQLRRLLGLTACEFVSLQYGDAEGEVAAAGAEAGAHIRLFPRDEIDDFEALAGLIENLDLVVSVQTAVVHLCGALGKTCLTMVPIRPEWRYTAGSETMPWYRSVRMFRQDATESWAPVIDNVVQAVAARAAQTS